LSLVGTTGKMLWDNTKLEIQGADATSIFETTATGAVIGGWTINASSIYKGDTYLNSTTPYIGIGTNAYLGSGFWAGVHSAANKMSVGANFFYDGSALTAAGWTIAPGSITDTTGTYPVVIESGANPKIYFGVGNYNNTDTKFYVDSLGTISMGDALTFDGTDLSITGTVYASAGSFTGNVSAGSGNIGNWNIVAGELAYGTDIVLDATNRAITINAGEITLAHNSGAPYLSIGQASKTYNTNGIYLGDDSGVFKMSLVGTTDSMTFDGDTLTLTGDIIAAGGTIANWDIGTNALSSGTVSLDSTSTNESFRVAKSSYSDDTPGIYLGNDSSTAKMYIGTGDNYLK